MLKILYLLRGDAPSAMRVGLNLFPNLNRLIRAHAVLLFACLKAPADFYVAVYTSYAS